MESNGNPILSPSQEKMDTEDARNEDDLLGSVSMDDVGGGASVSSSILDSDDEEDGVNVTIRNTNKEQHKEEKQSEQPSIHKQKLSGAKKKKYKKLINEGHSRDEALSLIWTTANESTPKRPRNLDLSNSSDGNPIPKKSKGQQNGASVNDRMTNIRQGQLATAPVQQPTYKEVAKRETVGILPKNYPQSMLTTDQMNVVQDAILQKVAQQQREVFKPKFINCWQRTGHLVIQCQDKETAEWLGSVVPALKPWEEAELTVVDADKIPRPEVLNGFFPQSVNNDNDSIRVFIESQNDGLRTDNWTIIRRNTLFENHVEWFFTVDEESMQHFKKCNFLINYKFGQTTLRKKGTYKTDSNHLQEPSEMAATDMAVSSDEPMDQNPKICGSSGNTLKGSSKSKHELNVPGTSGEVGFRAEVKSSKHLQRSSSNSERSENQIQKKINSSRSP